MVVAVSGYIITKGEVKSVRSLSWGERQKSLEYKGRRIY